MKTTKLFLRTGRTIFRSGKAYQNFKAQRQCSPKTNVLSLKRQYCPPKQLITLQLSETTEFFSSFVFPLSFLFFYSLRFPLLQFLNFSTYISS